MKANFGICHQTFIPVRAEPSEKSEMVTQILFGELFTISEQTLAGNFSLIKILSDGYEGWINTRSVTPLSAQTFSKYEDMPDLITRRPVRIKASSVNDVYLWLSAGSYLYPENEMIKAGNYQYPFPGEALGGTETTARDILLSSAREFLNAPYLWGGKSSFGTDCSGLVQNVYCQTGIALPRDTPEQAATGKMLSFLSEARGGDLAFFDNEEGRIVHVGLILEDHRILHASVKVRIDSLDHQGIFCVEEGRYTHKLRLVKQIIH